MRYNKCFMLSGMILVMLFAFSANSNIQSLQDNGNEIVLTLTSPDFSVDEIMAGDEACFTVKSSDASVTRIKGEPALPFFTENILLSDNTTTSLEIVAIKTRYEKIGKVVPSKGIIIRTQDPTLVPYTFGSVYSKNEFYPSSPVSLGSPYIMRDVRGVVLTFSPFQYNPVKGLLTITEEITVKIKETRGNGFNPLTRKKGAISPTFNKLYKRRFANFSNRASRYTTVADGDKMVIITASKYSNSIDALVEWENQKGIKTTKFEYPGETGGSGANSLQSFIKKQYNDNSITYFLLVGDYEDVPSPQENAESDGSNKKCSKDPTLVHISGNDNYQDAFIGRFSVSSSSEADVVVSKSIRYEKEPDANGDWYKKAVGIASSDGTSQSGVTDYKRMGWLKDSIFSPKYNYTTFTEVYDPNASKQKLTSALVEGRGLALYIGHGASGQFVTTGFGTSDANSLNNPNMPTGVFSVACSNGHFSGKTSFGEAMQRAGSSTTSKGSIFFLGGSIDISWVPPCDGLTEMVSLISQDKFISIGAIISNGLSKMVEKNTSDNTYKFWHIFGDPAMNFFTDTPKEIAMTSDEKIPSGNSDYKISLSSSVNGRIGFYGEKNGFLASQMLDKKSDSNTPVTVPADETKVTVTVTGQNIIPIIKELTVGNTGIVNSIALTGIIRLKQIDNSLSVKIPTNSTYTVVVRNIQGKVISSLNVSKANVWHGMNVSSAGMHLVTVTGNGKTLTQKYMITK